MSNEAGKSAFGKYSPLLVVLVGIIELAILFAIGKATSLWVVLLIVFAGWIIGGALLLAAGIQAIGSLFSLLRRIMGTEVDKRPLTGQFFTASSAVLFFFPGLITALFGVLLLLPPVQGLLRRKISEKTRQLTQTEMAFMQMNSRPVIDTEVLVDAEVIPPKQLR